MKNYFLTIHRICIALLFLFLFCAISCGDYERKGGPDVRDRNDELDGDDTKQPLQDQDSVNRVINDNRGKALDTLHNEPR